MYNCKYCNKKCKNKKSLVQHELRCKENPNRLIYEIPNFNNKGRVAWNKNLTSETDERVKHIADEHHRLYEAGKINIWCKGLTKETDIRIAKYVEKQKLNPNCGGLRNKSGYSKSGKYNGIYCNSSWELAYLIYCIDNNIPIKRCNLSFDYIDDKNIKHKYHPDFIINDNEIIEIKGFLNGYWDYKFLIIQRENIKVLYKEDMLPILQYVINKYGKDFIKLYEK